jgi:hypothetical protein
MRAKRRTARVSGFCKVAFARDALRQGDFGGLVVGDGHTLSGSRLVDQLGPEVDLSWQDRQVDVLERADIADMISWTRARETALVDTP